MKTPKRWPPPSPRLWSAALWGLAFASVGFSAETKTSHTQLSANGKFGIRLRQLDPDWCQVEVLRGGAPEYALDKCVGTIEDLYFISNDGSRFWVLNTLPKRPKRDREGNRDSWDQTVVATLFNRQGQIIHSKRLSDIVSKRDRAQLKKLQSLQSHFQWLEGVSGIRGKRPRAASPDKVELEIIGGKTYTLSF